MKTPPIAGVPLDTLGRVAIVKHRILIPALADALAGGLGFDNCDVHLRVVDVAPGVAYYVPLPQRVADHLADALQHVAHPNHAITNRKASSHEHN